MGSAHHSLRERPIVFAFDEGRFKSYYSIHRTDLVEKKLYFSKKLRFFKFLM